MDRGNMIETIVQDMEEWADRDWSGFLDHVQQLEREYLRKKSDEDLKEIYENTI